MTPEFTMDPVTAPPDAIRGENKKNN